MSIQFLLSRRQIVKDMGLAAGAALLWSLGGCEQIIQIIENRRVRRSVSNLASNDPALQTYKAAIVAMKALPSNDPRNWTNQASIHFNHCSHRNWYLLPWHRAYLLFFEEICQKLGGDDKFALPYWNWTANPSVPAAFWGGTSNPLFDNTRQIGPNDTADPSWVGPSVLEGILNEPDFYVFASGKVSGQRDSDTQGELESTPHNNIHVWISGDMGTFMSPLDPIFWQHHGMIDDCWVEWNLNRNHPNVDDPSWLNFTFSEFVDGNGSPVKVSVSDTILYPIFQYRYEPSQMGTHISTEPKIRNRGEAVKLEKFLRKGAPPRLEFTNRYQLSRALTLEGGRPLVNSLTLEEAHIRPALAATATERLVLTLKNVELPQTADYFVRVFVNKIDASPQTPIEDPHYAGSFGFFVDPKSPHAQDAGQKAAIAVDISDALKRLAVSGALSTMSSVDVQLVPVPFAGRSAVGQRFLFEGLELAIAKVRPF